MLGCRKKSEETTMATYPINEVLVSARMDRGLTHAQAAKLTGFTVGFIRSYEDCAKNPTTKTLFIFARAYNLRVTIDKRGVTIEDLETGSLLLDGWNPDDRDGPE